MIQLPLTPLVVTLKLLFYMLDYTYIDNISNCKKGVNTPFMGIILNLEAKKIAWNYYNLSMFKIYQPVLYYTTVKI